MAIIERQPVPVPSQDGMTCRVSMSAAAGRQHKIRQSTISGTQASLKLTRWILRVLTSS